MASRSSRSPRRPAGRRRSPAAARRRALLLLVVAVAVGVLAALALRSGDDGPPPVAGTPGPQPRLGSGADPLAYSEQRRSDLEARAARGLAHPLYAFSPGGAVASAARVAAYRPQIEAATRGTDVDPDVLEGMVLLESAGRPDAMASNDLHGAVGLTQILAGTATDLLDMRVDVAASRRLTRRIARGGPRTAAREAERRRVDERFDPAKSLRATVRYLEFARGELSDRDDLAVASYHMGVGNLQTALGRFDEGDDIPYAELFFGSSPLDHPRAHRFLSGLGDDSSTYLWRVRAAEGIMRLSRTDPSALSVEATRQTAKNSAEEVLHPQSSTREFATPDDLADAEGDGDLVRLTALGANGVRVDPSVGELAPRLDEPRSRYRWLQPGALAVLRFLGAGVQQLSDAPGPLTLTSAARDDRYQRLLTARNIEATRNYSLHTTGWAFDISRTYASRRQALAFQFLLDRLTALDLIAWVREPGAIHVTVSRDAARFLAARP